MLFIEALQTEGKMLGNFIRKFIFCLQVTLLDPKKSMNVNIFLKQFRKPIEVVIDLLRAGDPRAFGVEKLKGLSKVLPQTDEVGVTISPYGRGSRDFLCHCSMGLMVVAIFNFVSLLQEYSSKNI